jgi:hypothetical protein
MTHITRRRKVHCPYVRALQYLNRYLARLGWSERSNVVRLRLRVPIGAAGAGLGLGIEKDAIATLERASEHHGLDERIDVRWKLENERGPFPTFGGWLRIEAEAPKACTLTLDGKYDPPLGVAGKVFDAAFGQRIAEATAGQLLEEIGDSIELEYVQDEPHLSR